jgi:Mrp family chromosome partitioning ATPase
VLVEADRNGRLPAYASWAGLSDLLSGRASVGEALHRDPLTRLHVLPFGTVPDAVGDDALAGTDLATLLAALDATYAHIVVCAPSLIESDVAPALAATADCVVLVGEAGDVSTAAATAFELSGARSVQTVAPMPLEAGAHVRLAA